MKLLRHVPLETVVPPGLKGKWDGKHCMALMTSRLTGEQKLCALPSKNGYEWRLQMPVCEMHLSCLGRTKSEDRRLQKERKDGLQIWLATRRRIASVGHRPKCPGCGCGAGKVCRITWDENEGVCAPAGTFEGVERCTGCLTRETNPEARIELR